ncbi:hypothetical protein AK830_g5146 [Neonectria ditissima]|uniref:Uncharacterized protein n=1 Tax=Neonectria ditissima TaxID=78410 RepID=A0A0P7BMG3_9HYPO|nr:hypothetical protein AK830_g5146 [Neonectria ditissima]
MTKYYINIPPISHYNINNAEYNTRRIAILGCILCGKWRDAVYTMELHTGLANGLLEKFMTTLKEKAKTPKTPGSKKRNAFVIDDAPASESPSKRGRGSTCGRCGRGGGGTSETPTCRRSSCI